MLKGFRKVSEKLLERNKGTIKTSKTRKSKQGKQGKKGTIKTSEKANTQKIK